MQPMFGFIQQKEGRRSKRRELEMDRAREEREAFLEEKQSLKEQGIDLDAPQEALACPRCKAVYDFGAECPECRVDLVGVSAVDKVGEVRPYRPDRSWIFIYLLPGIITVLGGVGLWIFLASTG